MTATESDHRGAPEAGGEGTVHYAVHTPEEPPGESSTARPRGRPRESSGQGAQPQPATAPSVDMEKTPTKVTTSDLIRDAASAFSPPDIWSQDRPSLSQMWAYATRGDWTGPDGAPRRIGQIYALAVAVPTAAAAYLLAWAAERPARMIALTVLLVLLVQVPPLSWLI